MKRIYKYLAGVLLLGSILTSCSKDFLEVEAVGALSENIVATKDGINKMLNSAYQGLKAGVPHINSSPLNMCGGTLRGGEALKGSDPSTFAPFMTPFSLYNVSNSNMATWFFTWKSYDSIDRCNLALQLVAASDELTDDEKTQMEAEARFLRAHHYFVLWETFRNMPFVDEEDSDARVYNYDPETGEYIDSSERILEDFKYASENLAESYSTDEIFRVNKWAAKAYYAKMLLYMGNYIERGEEIGSESASYYYNLAKTELDDVILNGNTSSGASYALLDNYMHNFDPAYENGTEDVFSVQCSITSGGADVGNMLIGFFLFNGKITGQTGNALLQPTQWYVDHYRVDEDGLPYLGMYDGEYGNPDKLKSDDGLLSGEDYELDTVTPVDPRLDFIVGRRGVPFYDWGVNPGATWVSDQAYYGPYLEKKWMLSEENYNTYTVESETGVGVYTAQNTPIIRYADVLLWAAELEVRVNNDLDGAREYVNEIRDRASHSDYWVMNEEGTDYAANYVVSEYQSGEYPFNTSENALDAILYERTLELGLEGHRFFDLYRFGKDQEEIDTYISYESESRTYLDGADYDGSYEYLLNFYDGSITSSYLNGEATLKQNPGY